MTIVAPSALETNQETKFSATMKVDTTIAGGVIMLDAPSTNQVVRIDLPGLIEVQLHPNEARQLALALQDLATYVEEVAA